MTNETRYPDPRPLPAKAKSTPSSPAPKYRSQGQTRSQAPRGLAERIVTKRIDSLRPFPNNPRRHPPSQIAALIKNIKRVWTNPILIDEQGTILAGHGRLEAAKRLGMTEAPTLTVFGLSESEKRASVIADNRLPERAVWDSELLKGHFKELINIDFEVELTGFSTGEIDLLIDGRAPPPPADPADELTGFAVDGPAVSRLGDIWELGRHRVICGDALQGVSYEALMQGQRAQMVLADPPYNVPISGHAMGRGKICHREFPMACGEMSEAEFGAFLALYMRWAIAFSQDGSIHYHFMDWRHLPELLSAARPLYAEWKNLLVWVKTNGGQAAFTGRSTNTSGFSRTARRRT